MTAPRIEPIDSQWRPMCRKFNERAVEVMEREGVSFGERTSPYSGLCVNELRELYITELEKRQAMRRRKEASEAERRANLELAAHYFRQGLINALRKPVNRRHQQPLPRVMRHILEQICRKHGFSIDEMRGSNRARPLSDARQEFYYRAVTETAASMPTIGRFLGGKDHTTVLHGARVYAERNGLPRHDRANNGGSNG